MTENATDFRQEYLREVKKNLQRGNRGQVFLLMFGSFFAFILAPSIWLFDYTKIDIQMAKQFGVGAALAYGVMFFLIYFLRRGNISQTQLASLQYEMSMLEESSSEYQKAEKLFRLHQREMNRYYDQIRRRSTTTFLLATFTLVSAVSALGATLYFVHTSEALQKIFLLGGVGGGASIALIFISAALFRMYRSSSTNLENLDQQLASMSHLLFCNFFTSRIEENDLRDDTFAALSLKVMNDVTSPLRYRFRNQSPAIKSKATEKPTVTKTSEAVEKPSSEAKSGDIEKLRDEVDSWKQQLEDEKKQIQKTWQRRLEQKRYSEFDEI